MTSHNAAGAHGTRPPSRRDMLRSVAAVASTAAVRAAEPTSQPTSAPSPLRLSDPESLPTRPLGKTGVKITRLVMGASFPDYGPRLLTFAYRSGIRCFDNSHRYMNGKAEAALGAWANRIGRRDDLFIITKAKVYDPARFYDWVVRALERMKLDTIDLFMIHSLGDPRIARDPKGEWRQLKQRLLREKKIRFMGFSLHAEMPERIACLVNATKGGWADAMLVACDPTLIRSNREFDKVLDACAKAGLGLIAMKTGRGLGKAAHQPELARRAFEELGLTPHQAMQAGIFSDERFAAVCTEMPNRKLVEENCAGARRFQKPFDADQWKLLDAAAKKLARATCPGCDGSCRRAAGTQTDFCAIARYLAYCEEDGKRDAARALFAQLAPERRNWSGADLEAASRACHAHLDFAAILERARSLLA